MLLNPPLPRSLGFAAADAVIGHMERTYGSIFTKRSISVQLINNTGRVQLMDVETVAALVMPRPARGASCRSCSCAL